MPPLKPGITCLVCKRQLQSDQECNCYGQRQITRLTDSLAALKDLICHAWVHTGYRDCGYDQMTTAQRALYNTIVDRDDGTIDAADEMRPILCWKWDHAPDKYKNLSTHGGDEDWVFLIPPNHLAPKAPPKDKQKLYDRLPLFLQSIYNSLMECHTELPDGSVVIIYAH